MPENSSYSVTLARPSPILPGRFLVAALLTVLAITAFAAAGVTFQRLNGPSGPAATGKSLSAAAIVTGEPASETSPAVQAAAEPAEATVTEPERAGPAAVSAAVQTPAPAPGGQALPAASAAAVSPGLPGDRWLAEGFVFVMEGQEWDADSLANVDAALGRLPAAIRSKLGNHALGPVSILVNRSGRSLSGKQPYGGPANFFSTNDGRNELVLFPDQSVLTILHELGHAFNLRDIAPGRYATVLLEPEMQSFMAATGWRVLSPPDEIRAARDHMQVQVTYDGAHIWPRLSNDDPLEDFANSFALYFYSPEQLKQKSPERSAWFEGLMGR